MKSKPKFKVGQKVYTTTNPTFDLSKRDDILEGKITKWKYNRKCELYTYTIELRSGSEIERGECDCYSSYKEAAMDIAYNYAELREELEQEIWETRNSLIQLRKRLFKVDDRYNKWADICYQEA